VLPLAPWLGLVPPDALVLLLGRALGHGHALPPLLAMAALDYQPVLALLPQILGELLDVL
jgi:hypothetical protein